MKTKKRVNNSNKLKYYRDEVPDFDSENLDKLPIYYICQKKP